VRRSNILYATATDTQGNLIARQNGFFTIERMLFFSDASLELHRDGDRLVIKTDKYARSVELSGDEDGDEFGWIFEDNYLDMMPGETRRIRVSGRHRKGTIRAKAHYSTQTARLNW
jgi:hypothetical protein